MSPLPKTTADVAAELGITEYPRIIRPGMTEDEKREHVLALNLDRRHLTREQRQELVGRLRADGWSYRRIADRLHVDPSTAHEDAKAGVGNPTPEAESPLTVTGSDGKHYPAKRPSVVVDTPKQAARALELLDGGAAPARPMATVADLSQAAPPTSAPKKPPKLHLTRRDEILTELGLRADTSNKGGTGKYADVTGDNLSPVKTTADVAAELGMDERTAQRRKPAHR